MINEDQLSSAHGRTLLGLEKEHNIVEVAKKVIKEHMSVRALEEHVSS